MSGVVAYLNQVITDAEILANQPVGKGPAHNDQWHHWTIAHDRLEDELFSEPQRVAALARIALAAHHYVDLNAGYDPMLNVLSHTVAELSRVVDQQSRT